MKITERTQNKLVVENKPRLGFGIAIALGAIALLSALYSLLIMGEVPSKDTILGLVLGMLFCVGGVLLYTETTTIFDRNLGKVSWEQRGLARSKSDSAPLNQITDVVIGRPESGQSGGAKRLNLVLADRVMPLMFGFSGLYRDKEILKEIKDFIST